MKIVIIEDNIQVAEVISLAFEMRWPESKILRTGSGKKGLEKVEEENPDLVILDLGLPDIDGFEVLKQLRLFSNVPVIILTARDEESDIIKGLEWGADDYIVKPFRQLELMSRAQSILRRYNLVQRANLPAYGKFRFGTSIHSLFIGKKSVYLTSTEGTLLAHLITNAEKVIPVANLAEVIWGADYPGSHEAVRVYIRRLRKKIEDDPENPQIIKTHPGSGYSLRRID